MDLGGRDPAGVVAEYAARYRSQYSDDAIRSALRDQGFSPEVIEEGLRRAGPPAAAALQPPVSPAPAPAGRGWVRKLLLGAGALAALLALGVAALVLLAPKGTKKARALPPELASYKPERLADPAYLPGQLPEGLEDADAGDEYARIIAGRWGQLKEPGGFERLKESGKTLSETEARLLEAALRKRRCSILGSRLAPETLKDHLLNVIASVGFVMAATKHLREPARSAAARKDWVQAEALNRRLALFGWHMSQDWDTTTQLLGLTATVGGILGQSAARKTATGKTTDFDAAKASLDLAAYMPDKAVLTDIARDASDPARVGGLRARLAEPRSRRAYAAWAMVFAAVSFGSAETSAAAAAPERVAFFEQLSRDEDPRMASLAAAYGRMMRSVEAELRAVPQAQRERVQERLVKRVMSVGKTTD